MSPCDCGLVTPTLDELLAVARKKPLPRIRERRPPPAKLGATLKGWMEWRLVNRRGREVAGGEGPNLILDQGLDLIATTAIVAEQDNAPAPATFFPLIRYAAVGTNSGAPTTSDTGLGSELARTDATFATETLTRPSPGVYQLTRFIEFDYAVANGVLTEWGFSNSASTGSNLFNRALFVDGGGSPDAITKTSAEKLRLTYTLEVTLSPVTFTSGSFAVAGVGTVNGDYTLVGGAAPSGTGEAMRCVAPDLKLFSHLARGSIAGVTATITERPAQASLAADGTDRSGVTYTTALQAGNDSVAKRVAREVIARDAYVAGSFTRAGGAWKFDTAFGNLNPIRSFLVTGAQESMGGFDACQAVGYVFDVDVTDEFSKDDEHTLTIGVPIVTWGRAS